MGTGFTIDTPLKVARYGISSVISLVDDVLIEQIRKYHTLKEGLPYEEIDNTIKDRRALRITAYLNLVDQLVREQVRKLQASNFDQDGEITRYYELLPESPLRREYHRMVASSDPTEKAKLQEHLREQAVPGSIDVNIMTKLDRNLSGEPEYSDALAALRGFAKSTLSSSILFSAGLNQRLYSYAAQFDDFLPTRNSPPKKSIILKVSNFRSAEVQGRFLAKRGLWVNEYSIESGINCGGHAFMDKGLLMGPILEEFKQKKSELFASLSDIYRKALAARGLPSDFEIPMVRVTVQGGIGTHDEDCFLREYYHLDGTGWGTPFLLVPEATNVDDDHLKKLCAATEKDVYLSDSSPLNIPFWSLRTSHSEEIRLRRIGEEKEGSPCPKGFLVSNTEFTKTPICLASRAYQKRKVAQLSDALSSPDRSAEMREGVVAKACICHDLAGSVTVKYGIDPQATTAVCCGPNIENFSKIAGLKEMVDHIYGRLSLLTNPNRRHVLVQELRLYVDYFRKEISRSSSAVVANAPEYLREFQRNLLDGIEYTKNLAIEIAQTQRDNFLRDLAAIGEEIDALLLPLQVEPAHSIVVGTAS